MTFKSRLPPKHFRAQCTLDVLVVVGSHVDLKVGFGWETSCTHFTDVFYKKNVKMATRFYSHKKWVYLNNKKNSKRNVELKIY